MLPQPALSAPIALSIDGKLCLLSAFFATRAKAHQIKVVIASITPASAYPWKPEAKPADAIRDLNSRLKAFSAQEGLVYLDYYSAMTNAAGGLDKDLAADGAHPTAKGYEVMAPLAEKAIAEALK